MRHSPHPNSAYTVGWISALPTEMAAAKGMRDEIHGAPQSSPVRKGRNSYLLGSLSGHKVALTSLPVDGMGGSSAAVVAANMLSMFPNVRIGLLVGIGGGIPNYDGPKTRDIRLGDVVISSDQKSGGVIAHDFGRRLGDGTFEDNYHLNRPPRLLRTALSHMEMEHMVQGNQISDHIHPSMQKDGFGLPAEAHDILFEANYQHEGGATCATCNPDRAIRSRPDHPDRKPVIHYGVIASGSSIIKHAPTRDQIMKEHNAICVDREAIGLMNHFTSLVIRGIADYADSHKNDQWHAYAAATAAACAKELLQYVPLREKNQAETAKRGLRWLDPIKSYMRVLSGRGKS
ncbi:hypothetical protein AOR_1_424064 [Paecilomyces variotii No. 5]|uniref:Nucleoside phosphorylase domain-containing protein n=1 Tax=Byssochlamys spectabilis (strain No. 5 / NBRC 109023) TaxID=1356009 RepID=V5FYU8_BYSSN|nr:hypothetical protein AOR_1_424064 [Paecilomyces variotii No. 5]